MRISLWGPCCSQQQETIRKVLQAFAHFFPLSSEHIYECVEGWFVIPNALHTFTSMSHFITNTFEATNFLAGRTVSYELLYSASTSSSQGVIFPSQCSVVLHIQCYENVFAPLQTRSVFAFSSQLRVLDHLTNYKIRQQLPE